jgi:hypothetical protein
VIASGGQGTVTKEGPTSTPGVTGLDVSNSEGEGPDDDDDLSSGDNMSSVESYTERDSMYDSVYIE